MCIHAYECRHTHTHTCTFMHTNADMLGIHAHMCVYRDGGRCLVTTGIMGASVVTGTSSIHTMRCDGVHSHCTAKSMVPARSIASIGSGCKRHDPAGTSYARNNSGGKGLPVAFNTRKCVMRAIPSGNVCSVFACTSSTCRRTS